MLNKLAFRLNFSEIEERLDPIFYYKRSNLDLVNKTSLPVYKLKDVINMQRGRFGHRPRNDPSLYNGKYPFIQTGDVVRAKFGSEISYSQTLNDRGLKTSRLFSEPVVVLTIAANIGYTAILNYPACFPDSLIGLTSKNDLLELEYINIYISLIRQYVEDLAPQAAQKNINYQQLASIPIVVPAKDLQRKIIDVWNTAQDLEKVKRQQAKEKLSSIDAYLLEKLGVKLPRQEKQLKSRIFIRNYTEIMQSRWDSYFHQKHFINFHDELNNSIYPVIDLKNLSKKITSGITPKSGGDAYVSSDDGIPFIRSGDINIDGNLDYSNLLYIKEEIHNKEMNSSKLQKNDLMIAIVGATIGQIGIYLGKDEANINQAIALVRLKDDLNPFFFKELIKSSIGQWNLNHLKRPVARANINLEEISTMRLIVPPIEIQDELVEHIQKIRDEAKMLETEANLVLEKAKQEIEKMILGETE